MSNREPLLLLDFGSTSLKAALLEDRAEGLAQLLRLPALQAKQAGSSCTHSAIEFRQKLKTLCQESGSFCRLGITSQRSSFLLWDRKTLEPATPIFSWRDRSAASWCGQHEEFAKWAEEQAGLPLSPHYMGPTAAYLFEKNPSLRTACQNNRLRLGTLDSYATALLSDGTVCVTDLSMAARTLLIDPKTLQWGGPLWEQLNIPLNCLPEIIPASCSLSLSKQHSLHGIISDQAAALLAHKAPRESGLLINAGTALFLSKETGETWLRRTGLLSGPLLQQGTGGSILYSMEAPINSEIPRSVAALSAAETANLFCFPDENGWGAPFWTEGKQRTFSNTKYSKAAIEAACFEGTLFRAAHVIDLMNKQDAPTESITVSGGGASHLWAEGIAALTNTPTFLATETEATLAGCRLIANKKEKENSKQKEAVSHKQEFDYLQEKYQRWLLWAQELTSRFHQ